MPGSRLKYILFLAVVLASLFVAVEAALWLAGVAPAADNSDPFVGFAGYAPLFVPGIGADGAATPVTAESKLPFFNRQEFPAQKAPGTFRIFCVGGSTMYGHPYDDLTSCCGWLRAMLPKCDPSQRWELINAGGISYASYRSVRLMRELAQYEPNLFLVYSGDNEFLERRSYSNLIEMPAFVRATLAGLGHSRVYTVVARLAQGKRAAQLTQDGGRLLSAEVDTMLDQRFGPSQYERDEAWRAGVLQHFRYNLEAMSRIAKDAGASIVFITPPSNLADCTPFKSVNKDGMSDTVYGEFSRLLKLGETALGEGQAGAALEFLDKALALDGRCADALYRRGQALLRLGRYGEARAGLTQARDEDVCPLRAPSSFIEAVRDVAAKTQAPLVDFEAFAAGSSPHGIPGKEFFLDHVHSTIEGYRQLALLVMNVMAETDRLHPGPHWNEDVQLRVKLDVEAEITPATHAHALCNLARVLAWAGKHEDALPLARRAVEMAPQDAENHFILGVVLENLGHREEAELEYEEVKRLEDARD
ncbi:MAG: tetratricopeptide repeat protein [Candidatus Hydrogenedentes bacterium]|nr:tetratricopeptide repeat protein [Candidatus Hydrogenedentota bacterium]